MKRRRLLRYSVGWAALSSVSVGSILFAAGEMQNPEVQTPQSETATGPDTSEKKPVWQAAEASKLTHKRVNDSRGRYGLTALEWHSGLADVAESYAQKMGEDGFFSHTHNGQNGADRLEAAGLDMDGWGENIIYTWWDRSLDDSERLSSTEDVAEWCVNWWLQSEPHFENITDASFDSHGVGFYKTEDGKILGVELFGG